MASDQAQQSWSAAVTPPAQQRRADTFTASSTPAWERLALICGLIFAVLVVAGTFVVPNTPSSDDTPAKIVAYYAQYHTQDLANDYVSFVAAALFVVFLTGLCNRLRRGGDERGAALMLAFGAGLAAIAFEYAATAIEIAVASHLYNHVAPDIIAALYVVASRLFYTSTLFYGIFLAAVSTLLPATRAAPRWLAWLGMAASVVLILGSFAISAPHGPLGPMYFVGFILLLIWVIGVSISLLRRTPAAALA